MIKIRLSPAAREDLRGIKAYIADELQSPSAAVDTVTRITKRLRSLNDFPMMGAPLSSVVDLETDYRFLVCGNYTAFYRCSGNTVYIVRILYGRRDFMKILFGCEPEVSSDE